MDPEALHSRREDRRRALRRRRRAGLILAVATIAAAVIGVILLSGAGRPPRSHRRASHSATTHRDSVLAAANDGQARRPTPPALASTATSAGHKGSQPVPILMYHVIAPPPTGAPFPGLYVTPSEFAAQMQALMSAGWHAVTLDQVAAYWHTGAALGAGKPIVISFDNGYQSQYTKALPVLRKLGWVGDENIQLTGLPPSQGGLGPDEVRGLISAGWELDTQGISHADLITLDAEQLHEQVAVARLQLQRRYRVPVNWFCYPSGHYDATVIAAVKAAGFAGSTTVAPGWAHPGEDPYRLHRLRVLGGTSPAELLALIEGIREDPPAPASYNGG